MDISSFFNSKVKKMDWVDVGLVKFNCIAFGILLVILFPALKRIEIWWIIAFLILTAARPFYRVYFKK